MQLLRLALWALGIGPAPWAINPYILND